jgi:hypothetical protein
MMNDERWTMNDECLLFIVHRSSFIVETELLFIAADLGPTVELRRPPVRLRSFDLSPQQLLTRVTSRRAAAVFL